MLSLSLSSALLHPCLAAIAVFPSSSIRRNVKEIAMLSSCWGKSKFRSCSSNSDRIREAETSPLSLNQAGGKLSKNQKAKSFDEIIIRSNFRYWSNPASVVSDSDNERRCHPLPPPISLAPVLPLNQVSTDESGSGSTVSGSFSASVSSLSSAETDQASDPALHRQSEATNPLRSRSAINDPRKQYHASKLETFSGISISPRKDLQDHNPDFSSNGKINHARSRSIESDSKICKPRVVIMKAKQDDPKSPHPLPRPPGSLSSPSKWKKGKLIGRGTFGHVFLGFNSESGQMCAIKEVKVISEDSNSKESLKQLSQELTMLSQLSHPNIVGYLGSELIEDSLSVYLEYVSGGSIHRLLQEYGPFSEIVIRNYTAQILSGLAYLHGKNKVHRDVKGANILVGSNGEVKLADFGMAKHVSSHNFMHSFKGSPYWMAPEVIENSNGYSLSVDIWSLGCTIIEMATSKPPWHQCEGVSAIFKIANSKEIPEFPSHFSAEGKDFLKLCFQRDPSARPTASQLLEHPFVRDQTATKISGFKRVDSRARHSSS